MRRRLCPCNSGRDARRDDDAQDDDGISNRVPDFAKMVVHARKTSAYPIAKCQPIHYQFAALRGFLYDK